MKKLLFLLLLVSCSKKNDDVKVAATPVKCLTCEVATLIHPVPYNAFNQWTHDTLSICEPGLDTLDLRADNNCSNCDTIVYPQYWDSTASHFYQVYKYIQCH